MHMDDISRGKLMTKSHVIKKINTEFMRVFIKQQTAILESFLNEFCRVNGIKESELKDVLHVVSCPADNSIMIVNVDDIRDIKFGVQIKVVTGKGGFSARAYPCGEYLECEDKYPDTTRLIEKINGGNTGDTESTSGEQ